MLTVQRKTNPALWTSELRCATGRSALWWLFSKLNYSRILLPSYVPEGVLEPAKLFGKPVEHYRLNADMTPDVDDITSRIEGPTFSANCKIERPLVVVIHYFGFEAPTEQLKRKVNVAGGWLLEDCAHALWAEARDADFALWSLNKVMPTVDGSLLRARGFDIDCNVTERIPFDIVQHYRRHLRFNACDAFEDGAREYERYYEWIASHWFPRRMTQEAEILFNAGGILLENERAIRETRMLWYRASTPNEFAVHKFIAFSSPAVAAFAYPLVFPSRAVREKVSDALMEIGVMPATLEKHWCEHGGDFIHRHLLLPVDASVQQEDVERVGECLRSFVKRERVA